jgi:hypothetical protein
MTGQIAHKGDKAPIQAGQRWPASGPAPGTTPSASCKNATSGARTSSTPSLTSPMRSSRSVA